MSDPETLDVICWKCGKVAFTYLEIPNPGDSIEASKAIFVDGSQPNKMDLMNCQFCKTNIWPNSDGTSQELRT